MVVYLYHFLAHYPLDHPIVLDYLVDVDPSFVVDLKDVPMVVHVHVDPMVQMVHEVTASH